MNRLFIELRIEVPPDTNQDELLEVAQTVRNHLYDDFNIESQIECKDMTYELVMYHYPNKETE